MEKAMLIIVFLTVVLVTTKKDLLEDGKNAVFNCNAKVHYGLKTTKILATH